MAMKWKELVIFSQNSARLLYSGMLHKEAISKASSALSSARLKTFANSLIDSEVKLKRGFFNNPAIDFYLALIKLGIYTGRLAESFNIAANYLLELMPMQVAISRCRILATISLLTFTTVSFIFSDHSINSKMLILLGLLVLPQLLIPLRFCRDLLYCCLPFVGTWARQLALMELFSAMNICYNSRMHVKDMYDQSAESISNLYLKSQVNRAFAKASEGESFTQTFNRISFIGKGMISALANHEYSGKLAFCFEEFASELQKIVIAKLEIVKAVSAGIVLSLGICMPLMFILPTMVKIPANILILGLTAINGYIWYGAIHLAWNRYRLRAAKINAWWSINS